MANEENNINLLTDFYFPIRNQEKIFSSNAYKVLSDNNVDPIELLGVSQDPNSHSIELRNESDPSFKDKLKQNAADFTKGFVNFVSDIPNEMQMKSVEGLMQAGKLGVNLMPLLNKLTGSPFEENMVMDKAVSWNKSLNDKVNQFRDIYKQGYQISEGREPNGVAEFAGWIAQDYPYSAGIYKGLKQAGISDGAALILSVGLGTAISFDPKETSLSLNLFTQEIASIKKYLDIIPDTPNSELFDRTVQLFEGTALAKAIPVLFDTAKFLKKNIPSFVPGGSVATAGATAIGEVTDQTILNPNEPTDANAQNQDQSMLDTIKGGIDQFGNKLTQIGGAIKKEFSGEAMANPLVSKGIQELAPVFKSAVIDAIEKIPNKAPVEQILGIIKNTPGVTQQELKWIGLDDFLKTKSNQKFIDKKELADFIQANRIDVNEKKLGGELKLSSDFENRRKEFENKYEAAYAGERTDWVIGYDTYPVKYQDINFDKGFEKGDINRMLDFNQTGYIMDQIVYARKGPDLRSHFANDYYETAYLPIPSIKVENFEQTLADGSKNFELHRLFDRVSNVDKWTDRKTAEMLLTSPRFERNRIIYIDPLEVEKFKIENEYRKAARKAGGTRFKNFTEPGGTDYTELVLTVNQQGKTNLPVEMQTTEAKEIINTQKTTMTYSSPAVHFGTKNEIAHVRFKTRDVKGQKILSVEELQSDLVNQMQAGDMVFQSSYRANEGKGSLIEDSLKDFPFKNTWHELVVKRLVRYAADNQFDAIAFPKGIVTLRRYGMTDSVNGISITRAKNRSAEAVNEYDSVQVVMSKQDAEIYENIDGLKKYGISDEFANEIQKYIKTGTIPDSKLFRTETTSFPEMDVVTFRPKDKIEFIPKDNEGRIEFYDKVIPSYLKKYAKKWNAPIYQDTIDISQAIAEQGLRKKEIPVVVLKLTPEMKKSVQEKSQPLFNVVLPALTGATAAGGAKVISDSMQNNIISDPTKN